MRKSLTAPLWRVHNAGLAIQTTLSNRRLDSAVDKMTIMAYSGLRFQNLGGRALRLILFSGTRNEKMLARSYAKKAGVAFFIGGVQFAIGMNLAEIYFPGYNVSTNYISDLGAYCPSLSLRGITGPCTVFQPASDIFTASVFILGVLFLAGAYFIQKAFAWKPATSLIALTGIGALAIGFFPETTGLAHVFFSFFAFLFAGLSAIITFRLQRPPLSYLSVILGAVTLVAVSLIAGSTYFGLGAGGMERMVVYPVLLWFIGFGGHLMGLEDKPRV